MPAPAVALAVKLAKSKAVRKLIGKGIKIVIALFVAFLMILGAILTSARMEQKAQELSATSCAVMGSGTYTQDAKGDVNMSIVKIIIDVGRQRGMSDKAILTALAVSMIESGPRNLSNTNVPGSEKFPNDGHGSDHSSLGVFQQLYPGSGRDGKPWGTVQQLMDPSWATNRFYDQIKVVDPEGKEGIGELAWDVQRAAKRATYEGIVEKNAAKAAQWLTSAGATAAKTPTSNPAAPATPTQDPTSNAQAASSAQWMLPVPANAAVTSPFGPRNKPNAQASSFHQGVDYGVGVGTKLVSPHQGTVTAVEVRGNYGLFMEIDHGKDAKGQLIKTHYGHLSKALVSVGQSVAMGAPIALSGNSGNSTGPHLHFETVVNGTPVDPVAFLKKGGATDTSLGASCSPVDGSLTDPGVGPMDPNHGHLTPRAWNVKQLALQRWGCQTRNNQQPCVAEVGGYRPTDAVATSDHTTGNAVDIMVSPIGRMPTPQQQQMAYEIRQYFNTNAANVGVKYIISTGQIWSVSRGGEGWRTYNGAGVYNTKDPTGGHYDHVHVSVLS